MPAIPSEEFFKTIRDSLNRTIRYHKNALSKMKRPKKKSNIDKFLMHRKEVERCEKALETTVTWLYAWQMNPEILKTSKI